MHPCSNTGPGRLFYIWANYSFKYSSAPEYVYFFLTVWMLQTLITVSAKRKHFGMNVLFSLLISFTRKLKDKNKASKKT